MEDLLDRIPKEIIEAARLGNRKITSEVDKILVCGMGASGICGDILRDLVRSKIIIVNKDYNIPEYVDNKTLVFIISYSGNTEETINCYKQAKKKTRDIVIITSDGQLGREKDAIIVPSGLVPRYAIHYLFFPILKILEKSKVIGRQDTNIREAVNLMKGLKKQQTKKLALELRGRTPIVCVPNKYKAVGLRWVQQFNENSKVQAITEVFPELDHNSIEGYEKGTRFEFIVIRDKDEEARERKRIEITEKIIAKKAGVTEVWMKGKSDLAKIFYMIYFGDYMTYQLGVLNKENPYENRLITFLKKRLKQLK